MKDVEIVAEINKVLTLEHGHLGMYKDFLGYREKEIRRAFKNFMEIEIEHIHKLEVVLWNMGTKPSPLIEGGDIIGRMLGITVNLADTKKVLETYSYIEKKSHLGYTEFIKKLEEDDEKRTHFIAEFLASNMLEAKLMQLWHEDHLKTY